MSKNNILLIVAFLISLAVGSSTILSSRAKGVTLSDDNSFLYLPQVMRNFPHLTIFGMDGSSDFSQIAQSGASWIRLNTALLWSEVQPNGPYSFNWTNPNARKIESEILQARNHNLNVLLIVRSTPTWARKYPSINKRCGPIARDNFDEFANFMGEVVKRYSSPPYEVRYYAVWNEPDAPLADTPDDWPLGCWGDPREPYYGGSYYGELLREVYQVVKLVNPSAQIVVGSLLMYCDPRWVSYGACPNASLVDRANFFEGVLIGSGDSFDIVGFNGHVSYAPGKNPVWSERTNWRWATKGGLVDGKINYLLEKMNQRLGFSKPIMLTEGGLVDGISGDPFFEEAKSDYLVYGYANTWALGLRANFWYTFRGWKGSELISGATIRPAFYAMQTMSAFLRDASFINREVQEGFEKFVYHLGNQEIWLLIPTGENAGTDYTVAKPSNFVKLVDIYGSQLPDPGGTITFSRPTYVFRNR